MSITTDEIKFTIALSLVFFLRMMPLFMVLPVLALAAKEYTASTPQLLGTALGIYGLTQALCQIPFGILSDRFGRKPIIIFGLFLFALGSFIAANAESIYSLILGRALQGSGAIAAAILALASDLSHDRNRTKIMAILGISIGLAFCSAFIVGPILFVKIKIDGLFYISIVFAILAILILTLSIPTSITCDKKQKIAGNIRDLSVLIKNWQLFKLNTSIFFSHMILMANFVVIPIALRDFAGLPTISHWWFYLSILLLSLFIMVPAVILGDRINKVKFFIAASINLILLSQLGLIFNHTSMTFLGLWMIFFFGAFNYLEALLPAEISRTNTLKSRGTAFGLYSTFQFIGIFMGGIVGGYLYQYHSISGVHWFCSAVCITWFLLILLLPDNQTLPDSIPHTDK